MYLEKIQKIEATTDPVVKYGLMKNLMKDMETDLEFMKPAVLPVIQELKDQNNSEEDVPVVIPDLGSYNIQVRTTYEYSDEVNEKKKALDKLKKDEVREGIATIKEEKTILVFTGPKE